MGLIGGMMGNASNIKPEDARKRLDSVILDSEDIDLAFKLVRDLVVLRTNV